MKTLDLAKVWSWLCAVLLVVLTLIPGRASENESFYIVCPADQYVTCQDEIWDLSIYGNAYYHDYNGDHDAGSSSNTWAINSCNVGAIYRTWTVEDYNWVQHSCTQVIYVSSTGNFTESDITWPMQEYAVEGCNPPTDPNSLPSGYDYPTYNQEECSMVVHSYDDQWFTISATCKKLLRKWTVIDWCQFDHNSGSNYGKWTYFQVIKVSNSEIPNLVCLDDVTVGSYNCTDALVELPDLTIDGSSCGGYFTISNNSPHATNSGANASGVYPLGTTTVKYTVLYGCGLKKHCTFNVTVDDNKGPTAYCIASVAVPLMGIDNDEDGINDEGMVEIWAKDLDFGSSSSCGHDPLRFSFSEDPDDGFLTFTCDHLGENLVDMWVTDNVGNQSYCTVKVVIQNNAAEIENCIRTVPEIGDDEEDEENGEDDEEEIEEEYMFRILGTITDQFDQGVDDIIVSTSHVTTDTIIQLSLDTTINITLDTFVNASGTIVINQIHDSIFMIEIDTFIQEIDHVIHNKSDENGSYVLEEVPAEITLDLFGAREIGDDQRIDKDDVFFLLDYLLGEVEISNPLILLAGDTDDNGKLDFNDVMNLVNMVNGNGPLPTENPWMIFDANQEFENPLNPFADVMTYVKVVEGEHDKEMVEDFIAILKGDLVSNHINSNLIAKNTDTYSALSQNTQIPIEVRDFVEKEILSSVKVFPNPVNDLLNFELELNESESIQVFLYNAIGERVLQQNFSGQQGINSLRVNLNNEENGILIYEVRYGNNVQTGRLIKI